MKRIVLAVFALVLVFFGGRALLRALASDETKIQRLVALRDELARIVGVCHGGTVGTCRVLEALGDHSQCAADHAPAAS